MKILIVTPIFPPEARGPAVYSRQLVEQLSAASYRLSVVTFTPNPEAVEGAEIISVSQGGGTLVRQARLLGTVLRESIGADVIYAQGADVVGLAAAVVGTVLCKPVVIKFVGDLSDELVRDWGRKEILPRLVFWAEKISLFLADKIVFPAKHLQEVIVGKYKIPTRKTVVIYNAVEEGSRPIFAPASAGASKRQGCQGKRFVIAAGFSELLPVKNIAGVIRAVNKLQKRDPELKVLLRIVGDGGKRKNLEAQVRKLEIGAVVKFLGRLDNRRARERLRQADAFVLFSLHEGMPHAMIEAMAEGVPIVAADIPAVREVLENDKTALIVPAGDEEALAEALADLAEDPGKAQKLARNARALYERKFTWPEHIKSLQAVFAECY